MWLGHNTPTIIGLVPPKYHQYLPCSVWLRKSTKWAKLSTAKETGIEAGGSSKFMSVKTRYLPVKKLFILPVKKNSYQWKNLWTCPWKIPTARKKCQKCVRENNFAPVEKWQKVPKMAFTHTYGFHGGKKDWRREYDKMSNPLIVIVWQGEYPQYNNFCSSCSFA